jgi:hypothetical protein
MNVYTPELCLALAALPPADRSALIQALNERRRRSETYEMLLLVGGVIGLHRLYLRDRNGAATRLLLLLSAVTLLYTGLALVSVPILLGAGGFLAINGALWVHDYARRRHLLKAHHGGIEHKVLTFLATLAPRRKGHAQAEGRRASP